MKTELMNIVEKATSRKLEMPDFKAGDTITVFYKIKEGNKEREQQFQGVVLQLKGHGATQTFTVRKMSSGVGVERIFPMYSPKISRVKVDKRGAVRRARIFYLRGMTGKAARIEEKKVVNTGQAASRTASKAAPAKPKEPPKSDDQKETVKA